MLRTVLLLAAGLLLPYEEASAQSGRPVPVPSPVPPTMSASPFRGVYTVVYLVPDLPEAKAWYARAFGVQPYFDEPFYVGFNIAGWELGLMPDEEGGAAGPGRTVAYWGVEDADAALAHLVEQGATVHSEVEEVGGGIRVGTVLDPFGNVLGIVENPGFRPQTP